MSITIESSESTRVHGLYYVEYFTSLHGMDQKLCKTIELSFFQMKTSSLFFGILTFCNIYYLQKIVIYCLELLTHAEEALLILLNERDESIKEDVVHLMSRASAFFRNKRSLTKRM